MQNAYDVGLIANILCKFHIVLYTFPAQYKEKVVWLCKTRVYSVCKVFCTFRLIKLSNRTHCFATVLKLSTNNFYHSIMCFFPYLFTIIIWKEFWGRKFCGFNENLNFKDEVFVLLSMENCAEHDITKMNIIHTLHFQIV